MSHEASSSSGSNRGESVVVDVGRRRSTCGYCKSGRRSSISHGLWAYNLTVNDYQELIDRGWRRSGCFLYKPEMETTCCPCYTIRLKAADFVPSKEQSRVAKRMTRYIDGTLEAKKDGLGDKSSTSQGCTNSELSNVSKMEYSGVDSEERSKEQILNFLSENIDNAVQLCVQGGDLPCPIEYPKGFAKKVSQTKRRRLVDGSEDLLYTSSISFQIAAAMRRAKLVENEDCEPGSSRCVAYTNGPALEFSPKLIAEKLTNALQHLPEISDLSVRACNGHINFYSATQQRSVDNENQSATLTSKSSTQHKNKGLKKHSGEPQAKKRKLEVRLNRSSFDPEEFALYQKYQTQVHNDTPDHVTKSSYIRFLVDTPLIYVPSTGDGRVPPCGFGSFHQQYWIDDRLVAVGVIDILPKCLSSKYLFWDPEFAFLSLGKYGALNEIEWVKENEGYCPTLQYYYLGYYVHSCKKMNYKAEYRPSELLCPLRYQWVPHGLIKQLLDRKKYVVLSDTSSSEDGGSSTAHESESLVEMQQDDVGHENHNEIFDEDYSDPGSESSDDESFLETDSLTGNDEVDMNDILIGLNGSNMRYRALKRALSITQMNYLESLLRKYVKVVGAPLSERMVYKLNS